MTSVKDDGTIYHRARLRGWITRWDEHFQDLSGEELADLEVGLNRIGTEERRVCIGLMSGYSLREVSRIMELGKSASPARRLLEKALDQLEEALNGTADAARAARPAQKR